MVWMLTAISSKDTWHGSHPETGSCFECKEELLEQKGSQSSAPKSSEKAACGALKSQISFLRE